MGNKPKSQDSKQFDKDTADRLIGLGRAVKKPPPEPKKGK